MAKLTLDDLTSLTNQSSAVSTINSNSALVETALENTLSRDGTSPNAMGANLDMNNNRILNLPAPVADQEPLRLVDGQPILDDAEAARDEAQAALASFTDIWLGNQTGDPSTDLDLSPLEGGEIYFNTTTKRLRVYKVGTGWVDVAPFEDLAQIAAYVIAAAASAAAALTSENNAEDAAASALADKIAAAASAVSAASSASAAEVARDIAIAKAAEAAASALEAAGHSTDASAAKTAAEAALDSFTDLYLGEKNSTPLLDNDGNALLVGALYYDTGSQALKYYNGTIWVTLTNSGLSQIEDDIDPHLGNDLNTNGFDISQLTTREPARFLLNNTVNTSINDFYGGLDTAIFSIDAGTQYGMVYSALGSNIYGVWQEFVKNRHATGAGHVAVQSGDQIVVFNGYGDDGDQQRLCLNFQGVVDGTVSNNVVPSRWQLWNNNSAGTSNLNFDLRADRSLTLGGTLTLGADDAYAAGWNGSLAVATKNAIYDKIESILDGQTFTGAVVVPDDAYAVGWNGSAEVPTKNAVYDKIETLQPLDSDLTAIAAIAPSNDDIIQRKAGAWTNRTMAQLITDLGALGTTFQPLDADLTSWAGVTRASGFDTFAATPSLANLASLLTNEAAGFATFLQTPTSANFAAFLTDEAGSGVVYLTGGALGTPASATLTNATGLPLTGLVSDTTTALGIGSINLGHASDTTLTRVSAGKIAVEGSNVLMESGNAHKKTITLQIDGGGATIVTGEKGFWRCPYACTITKNTVLIDQSGAIVIDIWKDTYANYPPTVADTITASAKPTITASGTKSEDSTLTGWTTSIAAGDVLKWKVDSVTSAQFCTLELEVTLTQ